MGLRAMVAMLRSAKLLVEDRHEKDKLLGLIEKGSRLQPLRSDDYTFRAGPLPEGSKPVIAGD
jgi:hypothetical protein